MAVATTSQYWTSRMLGENPTSPTSTENNQVFSAVGSGASVTADDYWAVTDAQYHITPTTTAYTIFTVMKYATTPSNNEVLLTLDNGNYRVEVQVFGQKLKLVGATTVTSDDLDIVMAEENPVPLTLRLTLDASGNAKLYMREIIEDDDGATHYLSVTGSSGEGKEINFGTSSGNVEFGSVYVSTFGVFNPDELAPSDFATNTLLRMAMSVVQLLKDSKRTYLKTHVDNSSIRYGFDVSRNMIMRLPAPLINVMLRSLTSPTFAALGGGRIDQEYQVVVYVTTRGTNYENAYRTGLNIIGDCFDEIYRNTGLNGTTDSLMEYTLDLDHKLDDDDTVCTHMITFTYLRRITMRTR
tara:strand:+ start:1817 stop:2878 length:1062 start_codon:yes stop_codon:yes gene_type:complete